MNILFVEPFYSGSHKQFADQLKSHSSHNIELLTLEGRFWKWRMYGAALTLGQIFLTLDFKPDMIITTDMLDLPLFLSIIRSDPRSQCKIGVYFHENQVAYPWKDKSEDIKEKRDIHYGMMNYKTVLSADFILFNSAYNMNSFYDGIEKILSKMPDHKHKMMTQLRSKSTVMPLGLELNKLKMTRETVNKKPLILWNHRWEHDKNPDDFFDALLYLQEKGAEFQLAVVGESYKNMPKSFKKAEKDFKKELIHYGWASFDEYKSLLNAADVVPITSNHDFFGISVMEAIHCGAYPLLPKRLAYEELYDPKENPDYFYNSKDELKLKLLNLIQGGITHSKPNLKTITEAYDWAIMIKKYDIFFDKLLL